MIGIDETIVGEVVNAEAYLRMVEQRIAEQRTHPIGYGLCVSD